jgi:hypothetical protein
MPMPDSTVEEVRSSVLRYLRSYEEGGLTLYDLAQELAVMAPAYDHAMGGIDDSFGALLDAAFQFREQGKGGVSEGAWQQELEEALTEFRRSEAAW